MKRTQIKICGLTNPEDIALAHALGADYFGVIVFPDSPRGVSLEQASELLKHIPHGRSVLVDVAPDSRRFTDLASLGFHYHQLHCSAEIPEAQLVQWAKEVSADRLWLAPRMKPGRDFPATLLPYASTMLIDTYHQSLHGGTGQTGDWPRFRSMQERWPEKRFVLAGGINPTNICRAIAATQAAVVDVNSGVEAAPGVKDPALLRSLFATVQDRANQDETSK